LKPNLDHPNVLLITPQYAPDFGPSAPIYTSICEGLRGMGCNVIVITGMPHYGGAQKVYADTPRQEVLNGVQIFRERVFSNSRASFIKRILYHLSLNLSFTYSAFRRAARSSIDVYLADAPCFWSGLPIFVNAIIRRKPYIYIIHDIFPDVLVRLGVVRNQKIIRFFGLIENYYYSKAAFISVLSDGFKRNLIDKGVPAEKIVVIPPCVDTDFIKPVSIESSLRKEWRLEGKFVVLYSGNLGFSQDLDILLSVAKLFSDRSDICFVIVGEGVKKDYIQSVVVETGLKNIQLHAFLSHEMVPELYSMADISLVLLNKEIEVESVPSKTFTIMASGRPLIAVAGENTELAELLECSGCGIRVQPGNDNELYTAILRLYENSTSRSELGERARKHVLKFYTKGTAAKMYSELINACLKQEEYAPSI
jgi:colanic acid biosynthesis glycosyl transferase WcaI